MNMANDARLVVTEKRLATHSRLQALGVVAAKIMQEDRRLRPHEFDAGTVREIDTHDSLRGLPIFGKRIAEMIGDPPTVVFLEDGVCLHGVQR